MHYLLISAAWMLTAQLPPEVNAPSVLVKPTPATANANGESDPGESPRAGESSPAEVAAAAETPAAPSSESEGWRGKNAPVDSDASAVRQASSEEPVEPSEQEAATPTESAGLFTLAPDESPGAPLRLHEALASAADPATRLQIVESYWRLAAAQAERRITAQRTMLLDPLSPPSAPYAQARLASAQSSAEAAAARAEAELIAAQESLAELTAAPGGQPPLAADLPLAGAYRTQFERYFPNGAAPVELRRIHRALPWRKKAIDAAEAAVGSAREALEQSIAAFESGQMQLAEVLDADARLRGGQRELVAALLEYNLEIGEYALSVTGGGFPPETIAAMLIETQPAAGSVLVSPAGAGGSVVQPATGAFPLQTSPRPSQGGARSGQPTPATPPQTGRLTPISPTPLEPTNR